MAEYLDLKGCVVVSAAPQEIDEPSLQEKVAILWAMDNDAPPMVVRLEDGTVFFGAVCVEGNRNEPGVVEEAVLLVNECVPIPDNECVYVTKARIALLRDAVKRMER